MYCWEFVAVKNLHNRLFNVLIKRSTTLAFKSVAVAKWLMLCIRRRPRWFNSLWFSSSNCECQSSMWVAQTGRNVAVDSWFITQPSQSSFSLSSMRCCSSTTIGAFMILNLTSVKHPSVASKPLLDEVEAVSHRPDRKLRLRYPSSVQNLLNHLLLPSDVPGLSVRIFSVALSSVCLLWSNILRHGS